MSKKLLSLLAATSLILSMTACSPAAGSSSSSGSSSSKTDSTTPKKITMVLEWTPNTNHTGLYVAQELGYYKDAGLDVTIALPPEGGSSMLVAGGGAQFGIDAQDTLAPALTGANPLPITAVAALIQHNTSGIISLKGKGMDRPKGMENKTYATWDNPTEQAIIKSMVEKDGGDYSKINMIPSTVTDVVTALQTDVDAVWIYYAWDGIATKVKGIETDYLNLADLDPAFDYYTPVLVANNDFLKKDPDAAKKFLAATAKGYEYAAKNPAEAAKILLKASPELDEAIVMESQKWLADKYIADAKQWGYIEPARWDGFYTWLSANKLVEKTIAPGTGFSNEYLS